MFTFHIENIELSSDKLIISAKIIIIQWFCSLIYSLSIIDWLFFATGFHLKRCRFSLTLKKEAQFAISWVNKRSNIFITLNSFGSNGKTKPQFLLNEYANVVCFISSNWIECCKKLWILLNIQPRFLCSR